MRRRDFLALSGGLLTPNLWSSQAPSSMSSRGWRAGVARVDITPKTSLWMAGFAARKAPSQGTALPLHAKALALDDGQGHRGVLVTLDLLGVTGAMSARISDAVRRRFNLSRDALLLNASHTHSGPVVDDQLHIAYELDDAMRARIAAYTRALEQQIVDVVGRALRALAPATLALGEDSAPFAKNRRVQFAPDGPVDRRVPVLRVADAKGSPLAIVFGYACHNTTLTADFVQFHGDYAGVAQATLEKRHPGVTAMYMAGCGADANPDPRGSAADVERHGTSLADAVDRALPGVQPLGVSLRTRYEDVELPFEPVPTEAEWRAKLTNADRYVVKHAQAMLDELKAGRTIPDTYRDPVQVWRVGELTLVALGGEVVVDYATRLRLEHAGRGPLWVAGYSNDVFAYVPSRRILKEGGYEGGGAMIYYGRPGPFDPGVEELIVGAVKRLW